MLKFVATQWRADGWPTIDIEPIDEAYFLPVLVHLSIIYGFALPPITDCITGYVADFKIFDSPGTLDIDTYDFSIAFKSPDVRDRVLTDLEMLPEGYFDEHRPS